MIKKTVIFTACLLFVSCAAYAEDELLADQAMQHYTEAVAAQLAGRYAEADVLYQKVLYMVPYNKNFKKFCMNNRGVILAKMDDLPGAEAIFKEALELDPDYKPAQINLGFINEKRRSRIESLEYWHKVYEIEKIKPKDYVVQEPPQEEKKQASKSR